MATASKKQQPVLASWQLLLQANESIADPQKRGVALVGGVNSAMAVLPTTPTLHGVAMETLTSAYQLLFSQHERNAVDNSLSSVLSGACTVLDSLLEHCPEGWSVKILKWSVGLLGRLSTTRGSPSAIDEAMKHWLTHPILAPINGFVDKCTEHLVSLDKADLCVGCVLHVCRAHPPRLCWLLAHIITLHPSPLLHSLLTLSLSGRTSEKDPNFTTLCLVMEFLAETHREVVRVCGVKVLEGVLEGRVGSSCGSALAVLLSLAAKSRPVLAAISSHILQTVTPVRISALVAKNEGAPPPEESHDGVEEEEDEGEIHSDDEEVEEGGVAEEKGAEESSVSPQELAVHLAKVVCLLRGEEAGTAISYVIQVYREMKQQQRSQEDAMEEGEIVKVSPVKGVVEGCESVMEEVCSHLHVAATHHLYPSPPAQGVGRGGAKEAEFALGLCSGLGVWSRLLLSPEEDATCCRWLQDLVTGVSISCSELLAANTLAGLLCNCSDCSQLPKLLSVYWKVQSRHSNVVSTSICSTLATLQHAANERERQNFFRNMTAVLTAVQQGEARTKNLKAQFIQALSEHTVSFSHLLALPGSSRLLDLLLSLPREGGGDRGFTAQCKLVENLLAHYFRLLGAGAAILVETGHTHLLLESSLGKCRRLLSRCLEDGDEERVGGGEGVRLLVYSTVMDTIMSKETSHHFSLLQLSKATGAAHSPSALLLANRRQGHRGGYGPLFNTRAVQHSGTLLPRHPLQQEEEQLEENVHQSITHNVDHVIQLLEIMTRGSTNQLASVFLDCVAPHSQPSQWPPEDSQKYSLEWDLKVKRCFDTHPILWQVLLLISRAPTGLVMCAPVIQCQLAVLSQQWQRCTVGNRTMAYPKLLEDCLILLDCITLAKWLPSGLAVGELLPHISPHEAFLCLRAVYGFIKEHFNSLKDTGQPGELKDTSYTDVVKGVIIRNIDQLGSMYARLLHKKNNI